VAVFRRTEKLVPTRASLAVHTGPVGVMSSLSEPWYASVLPLPGKLAPRSVDVAVPEPSLCMKRMVVCDGSSPKPIMFVSDDGFTAGMAVMGLRNPMNQLAPAVVKLVPKEKRASMRRLPKEV
jgi:hypothetical protein